MSDKMTEKERLEAQIAQQESLISKLRVRLAISERDKARLALKNERLERAISDHRSGAKSEAEHVFGNGGNHQKVSPGKASRRLGVLRGNGSTIAAE